MYNFTYFLKLINKKYTQKPKHVEKHSEGYIYNLNSYFMEKERI